MTEPIRHAVSTAGMSTTRAKNVGDRQKTAQRLLRSAADRAYDGEVDINWDAPLEPDKRWMLDHRQTLYGTYLWDRLTEEQRRTLGMHEAVSALSFGLLAEAALSTFLLRQVIEYQNPGDEHSRYALAEVGEETRHSTMFSRLINKSGLPAYQPFVPKQLFKAVRLIGLVPMGPATMAGLLLVEETLDRLQRENMDDPRIQPHMRQLNKIHVLEEARHITYAREELVRQIGRRGKMVNAAHRLAFAIMVFGIQPAVVTPRVYRSVGIHPLHGLAVALLNPNYRENAKFAGEMLLRYAYEVGMVRGAVSTRILRLARALPDDVAAELSRPV
ncbi:AurF N-oxygenase family protein [Nocardia iowensis]|uniref:Diiron oxygenase n=1 Tax=Nocardia iowensis TaxID=204891 RepID=A0ABX8RTH1_NOCIO|nr:diiron oxygenase [Nocardia iowensis]QXN92935.1 diiron oxygenase [Nocardia iowensis]